MNRHSRDNCKIYVDGLSESITKTDLRNYFATFGTVEDVKMEAGFRDNIFRGFAFILFKSPKSLEKIFTYGLQHVINGHTVNIKLPLECMRNKKIIVRSLSKKIGEEDIKEYFMQFGTIVDYNAPMDTENKRSRNFCFITFLLKDAVDNVLKISEHSIIGKKVDVQKANPNPKNQ